MGNKVTWVGGEGVTQEWRDRRDEGDGGGGGP